MDYLAGNYDVLVIGGGHAGCEAALSAAKLGSKTLMFSINLDSIAAMPCNPSIGGTAKGHLVREIDALGGQMGKLTDETTIQSKILNRGKGPAVYSLRAQVDRKKYGEKMKFVLESQENLDIRQAEVIELMVDEYCDSGVKKVNGVRTLTGGIYTAKTVILTTGTYLRSRVILGDVNYSSGPEGLFPSNKLSENLEKLGLKLMRFKTGTPARISSRSVDFSKMEPQPGDEDLLPFSFEKEKLGIDQVDCYLTYTNERTHEIIKENLHRSPLFSGNISGVGPRYCPSIEDKVIRFEDKNRHQLFVEPMGLETNELYLQGMSSSLPEDVYEALIQSIDGLENAKVTRSAYAIEYDCLDPTTLNITLEVKGFDGLFSAGQINGTSGYEEAGAQGLIAGINAALKVKGEDLLVLKRSDAYIGVLIDDLVTKGTNEPYRMMTSRAEYRLYLRQDNADFRLTPIGRKIGLICDERYNKFKQKWEIIDNEVNRLKNTNVTPKKEILEFLESRGTSKIANKISLGELLKRPEITYDSLGVIDKERDSLGDRIKEQVEIIIKYEGYINRQLLQIEQFKKLEKKKIPKNIDYSDISGLRIEAIQKLSSVNPVTVGQASRISGVSPADISVLLVYLETRKN